MCELWPQRWIVPPPRSWTAISTSPRKREKDEEVDRLQRQLEKGDPPRPAATVATNCNTARVRDECEAVGERMATYRHIARKRPAALS